MANTTTQKRILVIGVPDMAYSGILALINASINIVGVMGPLKSHNTYHNFKSFVEANKLNFIEYDDLKSPKLYKTITELKPDLAVVFSFNHKLPIEFINLIKDGILNLHPSLLPEYRGGNPYSRVIMNGETETGVTIHFMSENFDEGDIVAQVKCPIDEFETMGTIFNKTNYLGISLMVSALKEYEQNGKLPRHTQPKGEFKKAKNLSDMEFLIDFNNSAVEIERLLRAVNPFLHCYTHYKGQILKLHKATVVDYEFPENTMNGEIVKIENDRIFIKTSKGAICPEIIQFGALFLGDSKDFIQIVKPKVGDVIGYNRYE